MNSRGCLARMFGFGFGFGLDVADKFALVEKYEILAGTTNKFASKCEKK